MYPAATPRPRPRARDLGIVVGPTPTGPLNALTDVPEVRVGHTTVRSRPDVHSGVTAVLPEGVRPGAPLPAGVFVGNGYGKLVGATQLAELGELETPCCSPPRSPRSGPPTPWSGGCSNSRETKRC